MAAPAYSSVDLNEGGNAPPAYPNISQPSAPEQPQPAAASNIKYVDQNGLNT